jgi:6-phosphogluconolactonase
MASSKFGPPLTSKEANAGTVIAAADPTSLALMAAHLVRAWIGASFSPSSSVKVAISGGSTPRAMFRILATLPMKWGSVEWFWVDERCVPASSDRSNFGAARADLFSHVPVPPSNVHPMVLPDRSEPDEMAKEYEKLLAKRFGLAGPRGGGAVPKFDLILIGIGDDGHTASLFPGETHVNIDNRWTIGVPMSGEREARVTLTRPVLTQARRVVVLAQGANKRPQIEAARQAGSLVEVPSRLTREVTGELIWLVDAAAAPSA